MAVPKRKTSKSKRDIRRGSKILKPVNYCFDSVTGELTTSHRISLDGYYKGKKVLKDKVKNIEQVEQKNN